MERESKKENRRGSFLDEQLRAEELNQEFDKVSAIQKLAAANARAPLNTEDAMLLYLKSWWSRVYNRPLKDPLLESYTFEELLYEFYDRQERAAAVEEKAEEEAGKIEVEKEKAALDWAEEEEKRELEEARKAQNTAVIAEQDPTKDPANIKWMEEQIRLAKQTHGDTFGEDLNLDFES